jgi:hypothetical protein
MRRVDTSVILPKLEDKCFYWVKLNYLTRWQPAMWDANTKRMRLYVGGYRYIDKIEKINPNKLVYDLKSSDN